MAVDYSSLRSLFPVLAEFPRVLERVTA